MGYVDPDGHSPGGMMGECRFVGQMCVEHSGGRTTRDSMPALCTTAAAELERRTHANTVKVWDQVRDLESRLATLQRECGIHLEQDHGLSLAEVCKRQSDRLARLEEAEVLAQALDTAHEFVARLEEEKAQAERVLAHLREEVEDSRNEMDRLIAFCDAAGVDISLPARPAERPDIRPAVNRLAQAEAREAAVQEAIGRVCQDMTDLLAFQGSRDSDAIVAWREELQEALSAMTIFPQAGRAPIAELGDNFEEAP